SEHSAVTEALNALHVTTGCMAAVEPITVTLPRRWARMVGITARSMLTAARKLLFNMASHVASSVFSTGFPSAKTPTRWARQWPAPPFLIVFWTAFSAAGREVRSALVTRHEPLTGIRLGHSRSTAETR